ncbi:MAG: RAMP superfamily CRISPR-associated protein, partial [Firmicutes bacterium]|nr:RAMP superfamily CRISPR-associated protein [Bacillota bacterium]
KNIEVEVEIAVDSFLHIGGAASPLTEKKGTIFKIEGKPVIPASSFKGALRYQLEQKFINEAEKWKETFNVNIDILKPCIPSSSPTRAEQSLISSKSYRGHIKDKKYDGYCEIKANDTKIVGNSGLCPVCYFMGAAGIMGFLRISNFLPQQEGNIIEQTNIRLDRKMWTAANKAKVDGEQVKPGTKFFGMIEILDFPVQDFHFGHPRKIGTCTLDKWLENCKAEDDVNTILIEDILKPALESIQWLGGQKSKGAGKVTIKVNN